MATASTTAPAPSTTRTDLAVLVILAVAVRLPAFTAQAHLTFDDGVYGASAVAMRAGWRPFREVFSSQGPLHLPLVWAADLLGGRSANTPRLAAVLAGAGLVIVTYLAGQLVSDRGGAILAAGLVGFSGSVMWVTGPLSSDGVALFFAGLTMLLVLQWRHHITLRRALWLGLAVSATISVKALLLPVVVPVALVLIAHRRVAPILAAAGVAVGSHLLLWLPWGPTEVWEQSYGYHLEATAARTPWANLGKILSTLVDRDLPLVLVVLAAMGGLVLARGRRRQPGEAGLTSPDTLLLAWLGTTLAVLIAEQPLWRPHVSALIPALALLAARHRPPRPVLLAALAVSVPLHAAHLGDLVRPAPFRGATAEVVTRLAELPEGALAISDDPGLVWRAGRSTPPDLVDTSILRIEVGQITTDSILAAAGRPQVCAVAVRSAQRWGSFPDLPAGLAALGYSVAQTDERGRVLYIDEDCDPG